MERLTIRNSDGSVSQPTDLKWAEALDRLAAYEDAGPIDRLLELVEAKNNGYIKMADIEKALRGEYKMVNSAE